MSRGGSSEAELFSVDLMGDIAPGGEIGELAWIDPRAPGDILLAPLTRDHVLPLVLAQGRDK
jgi:8-oxo-dGTP diphosphatase